MGEKRASDGSIPLRTFGALKSCCHETVKENGQSMEIVMREEFIRCLSNAMLKSQKS